MPIVKINMCPNRKSIPYGELEVDLEAAFLSIEQITGVLPGEVMVDVRSSLVNVNNFVYVEILMYKRSERDKRVMATLCMIVGDIVASFFSRHKVAVDLLEVLPPRLIDENDCYVLHNAKGGKEK